MHNEWPRFASKGEKARLQYSGVRVEYKRSTSGVQWSTAEYSGVQQSTAEYSGVQWSTSGVRGVRWSTGVPESRLFPLGLHRRLVTCQDEEKRKKDKRKTKKERKKSM